MYIVSLLWPLQRPRYHILVHIYRWCIKEIYIYILFPIRKIKSPGQPHGVVTIFETTREGATTFFGPKIIIGFPRGATSLSLPYIYLLILLQNNRILFCIRGHPFITSRKKWKVLTPTPSSHKIIAKNRNFELQCLTSFFSQYFYRPN